METPNETVKRYEALGLYNHKRTCKCGCHKNTTKLKITPVNDKLARQVLAELRKLDEIKDATRPHLHFFSNSREQGYVLSVFGAGRTVSATFAENRNSDAVVVYFSDMNNICDDAAWKNAGWYKTPKDAAIAIRAFIVHEVAKLEKLAEKKMNRTIKVI